MMFAGQVRQRLDPETYQTLARQGKLQPYNGDPTLGADPRPASTQTPFSDRRTGFPPISSTWLRDELQGWAAIHREGVGKCTASCSLSIHQAHTLGSPSRNRPGSSCGPCSYWHHASTVPSARHVPSQLGKELPDLHHLCPIALDRRASAAGPLPCGTIHQHPPDPPLSVSSAMGQEPGVAAGLLLPRRRCQLAPCRGWKGGGRRGRGAAIPCAEDLAVGARVQLHGRNTSRSDLLLAPFPGIRKNSSIRS